MTDFKRRTLFLNTGRQIKLYGNSMAIAASLEIGEGSAPNIFSFIEQNPTDKTNSEISITSPDGKLVKDKPAKKSTADVLNPHRLNRSRSYGNRRL